MLRATDYDLNRSRLETFFGRSATIPQLDLPRREHSTQREENGGVRTTVAGLQTFGPGPTEFRPACSIQAASNRGKRLHFEHFVHAESLRGPVSNQIHAKIPFVAQFVQLRPKIRSHVGTDTQYDLDLVDDAVVNAVVHRAYAISGAKIQLVVFADLLELYSPGDLPSAFTFECMPFRTPTRNQQLASCLPRTSLHRFITNA